MAKSFVASTDSILLAMALRAWAVDAPFQGHGGNNPEAKLLVALLNKQVMDSMAESLTDKAHQTALQAAGKKLLTEAIREVSL